MQATLINVMRRDTISLRYAPRLEPDAWILPEGSVPESAPHDSAAQDLKLLLEHWAARSERQLIVYRNMAIRWDQTRPQIGVDPDVCIVEPPPPSATELSSLCLWKSGHVPPQLCFEIVSRNHPYKDYEALQDRYALLGAQELIVFDPLLAGPRALGGPVLLQHWLRSEFGGFERVAFGSAPVYSKTLEAWIIPSQARLNIAADRAGTQRWLTELEAERAAREQERAAKEQERAAKEQERAAKEQEQAAKEQERAAKEQERAARLELEQKLAALETRIAQLR